MRLNPLEFGAGAAFAGLMALGVLSGAPLGRQEAPAAAAPAGEVLGIQAEVRDLRAAAGDAAVEGRLSEARVFARQVQAACVRRSEEWAAVAWMEGLEVIMETLAEEGVPDQSLAALEEARRIAVFARAPQAARESAVFLGTLVLLDTGRLAEAVRSVESMVEAARNDEGAIPIRAAPWLLAAAQAYHGQNEAAAARTVLLKARELLLRADPPDSTDRAYVATRLADACSRMNEIEAAQEHLREALVAVDAADIEDPRLDMVLEDLREYCDRRGEATVLVEVQLRQQRLAQHRAAVNGG